MRLIYEKSIVDKIQDALNTAVQQGKKVSHIEVTKDEWRQLVAEVGPLRMSKVVEGVDTVLGYPIRVTI